MPTMSDKTPEDYKYLLVRLDERTLDIQRQNEDLKRKLSGLEDKIERNYVSKEQFIPVQRAVYAAIGLILSGFFAVLGSTLFHTSIK